MCIDLLQASHVVEAILSYNEREILYTTQYMIPCYSLKSISKPNEWEHITIDVTRGSIVSMHHDFKCKTLKYV